MLPEAAITRLRRHFKRQSDRLPMIFGVLGDRTRFCILRILFTGRDVCVTDIARILEISVPAASQQLTLLQRAGLVRRERKKQMICYELKREDPAVKLITAFLRKFPQ